ncbi:regulatory protein [Novosphingobium sp. PhB165]|uniref:regulatory protein RecX n=1 Tax=Novosphingobium sp. PhB165 TaxID=2485105 RepID=UPI001046F564|nr:RecX family transcriptional regulator [Novosphingobium sp. PhB165]TCM19538.1 regulatory protein [Novosphingobium sp. PhB165]
MSDKRRNPQPLDQIHLEELALAYVARFATTQGKLRDYLQRKLRERGWAGDESPDLAALVARYSDLGYVDDAAWARMKAGSLLRRGYGARRVGEALGHAGLDEDMRAAVRPDDAAERQAALVLARRRRFGPFAVQPEDRLAREKLREKHIAAMLRAGHRLDMVRAIVDAEDPEAAEEWADAGIESEAGDV